AYQVYFRPPHAECGGIADAIGEHFDLRVVAQMLCQQIGGSADVERDGPVVAQKACRKSGNVFLDLAIAPQAQVEMRFFLVYGRIVSIDKADSAAMRADQLRRALELQQVASDSHVRNL